MIERYFFEIPIYGSTPDFFYTKLEEDTQKYLDEIVVRGGVYREQAPEVYAFAEEHFRKEYGLWRYNEAIGWIRLYVLGSEKGEMLGSQIRGDLWFVDAKRIRRKMRKKNFCYYGEAFELHFSREDSSAKIYNDILSTLEQLDKERPFKGRYLDLEAFRNIGPLVNWRELIGFDTI